ncbi:hypothetical protein GE09DRAFT_581467 [Coniochaeta sp. 2T2.1]|nr:hypothetical protein GE09DRAFT_581467 [Coniochaeta sp. 2T2.1]
MTARPPFDGRDQADLAEEYYQHPVRMQNRQLVEENLKLKGLLRTHGISWSPSITFEPQASHALAPKPSNCLLRPRSSLGKVAGGTDQESSKPHLPVEIQLRIIYFALTSKDPIIDPLCKLRPGNITAAEKTLSENQLAIGLLATSKAFHTEGTRILWNNNTFTFTTHHALRNFANLDLKYREGIKSINLRIIAQFYDDEKTPPPRKIPRLHHKSLYNKDISLKVHRRHRESALSRRGFRVYAWSQFIDFLDALRPPHYFGCDKAKHRPRLLPNIEVMRIDFVNFFDAHVPFPEHDLHEAAGHDHGCTLKELMITGMPCTEAGQKGSAEISRMVRDSGLFMDAGPAFVQLRTRVKPLSGKRFCKKVTRAWRVAANTDIDNETRIGCYGMNPPVPEEEGHPESSYMRPTVWKLVPTTRDSEQRMWVEFDKKKGLSVEQVEEELDIDMDMDVPSDEEDEEIDEEEPDFPICAKCYEPHPMFF